MERVRTIAIVGGGLAGLATATALGRFGFDVDLFERASTLAEVGAGINISPQAVKALRAIGLGEKIFAAANVHPDTYTFDMQTGELVDHRRADAMASRG